MHWRVNDVIAAPPGGFRSHHQPAISEEHAETQSARSAFPAGAIPTVDFLLHHARAAVKKMHVKTLVRVGSKISAGLDRSRQRRSCCPRASPVCGLKPKAPARLPGGGNFNL